MKIRTRRHFCLELLGFGFGLPVLAEAVTEERSFSQASSPGSHFAVAAFDRARILRVADDALVCGPVTLLQASSPGAQKPQYFVSEKVSPTAEGKRFERHAELLIEMNRNVSALTAAWRLTEEARYFHAATVQLHAWCVDADTRMLPNLDHAGIVPGVEDDRNNGVVDTVSLAETARAAAFLCASPMMPEQDVHAVRQWFVELLSWFTDSRKGSIARQTKTIEAICWTMQAAEFARFTRNDSQYRACVHLFRDELLRQMSFDGNFEQALRDRNPYAASMFALECMAAACESLSTPFESMWQVTLPDGRGMRSAIAWALPFLKDRRKWPYLSDAVAFKAEPIRENALLFAGRAYDQLDYLEVWKALPPDSPILAIERFHPITQPALWATRPPA